MKVRLSMWLTAALVLALVVPAGLMAAEKSEIPRRADGKPDLSGTYDVDADPADAPGALR